MVSIFGFIVDGYWVTPMARSRRFPSASKIGPETVPVPDSVQAETDNAQTANPATIVARLFHSIDFK